MTTKLTQSEPIGIRPTDEEINELIAYLEDKEYFPDGEILDYKDRELIIDALVFYKEMN